MPEAAERENSLAAQTKRYEHVLPRMPSDPGEIINFFDTCENLRELYDVSNGLRAKVLLPLLTAKAKSLINRLSADAMGDVQQIKNFLLSEFKLTSREYNCLLYTSDAADE